MLLAGLCARACVMIIYMKTDGWRSSESANHEEPAEPSKRMTKGRGESGEGRKRRGSCEGQCDAGGTAGHALAPLI